MQGPFGGLGAAFARPLDGAYRLVAHRSDGSVHEVGDTEILFAGMHILERDSLNLAPDRDWDTAIAARGILVVREVARAKWPSD